MFCSTFFVFLFQRPCLYLSLSLSLSLFAFLCSQKGLQQLGKDASLNGGCWTSFWRIRAAERPKKVPAHTKRNQETQANIIYTHVGENLCSSGQEPRALPTELGGPCMAGLFRIDKTKCRGMSRIDCCAEPRENGGKRLRTEKRKNAVLRSNGSPCPARLLSSRQPPVCRFLSLLAGPGRWNVKKGFLI